MEVVMVEFAVGKDKIEICVDTLSDLMNTLMTGESHFHGATIYVEQEFGVVINAMKWDSHKDFVEFRDANLGVIGLAIGKFNPNPRWLTVKHDIESR